MKEINAVEVKRLVLANKTANIQIVDVREPDEYAKENIPGAILIPLGQVAKRLNELDKSKTIIMQCVIFTPLASLPSAILCCLMLMNHTATGSTIGDGNRDH